MQFNAKTALYLLTNCPVQMESGEGAVSPPRKIFVFSIKMVHFNAFWSTFYTNFKCHYDVLDTNSNILKPHMLNSAAKGKPRNFCADFSEGRVHPP